MLLQETHCLPANEHTWEREWGGKCLFSNGSSRSKGTAILFKKGLQFNLLNSINDEEGRYVCADIEIFSVQILVACVYGPIVDNPIFFHNFFSKVLNTNPVNIIVGGDLNLVLNDSLDKSGGNIRHANVNSQNVVNNYINNLNLVDIFRCLNPMVKKFTRSQVNPPVSSRLDYLLISHNLSNFTEYCDIILGTLSDHSVVLLSLTFPNYKRGRSFWKFNSSLIYDKSYVSLVKDSTREFLSNNDSCTVNPCLLWDTYKAFIRGVTIQYSAKVTRQRKQRSVVLETQINSMLSNFTPSVEEASQLRRVQTEYDELCLQTTKGAMLRSKCKWAEHGEKSNKYFLNLEKRNANNRCIHKLNINGSICTNPPDILNGLVNYFEKLYSPIASDRIVEFLDQIEIPKLSEVDKNICEGKLTAAECFKVLNSMANDKSPGLDGLSPAFYKCFWFEIKDILINCLNYAFDKRYLGDSLNFSLIVLLPKPNKDHLQPENYRPISLLGTDYKIASKSINERIKKVINSLIHFDQNGFLSNRYIGDNIRLLFDLIDTADYENINGLIISTDFLKAFDSITWEFILACLTKFGFGNDLLGWVETFYSGPKAIIENNGHLSRSFDIHRGVRQGDALSPSLSILCVEMC